MAFRFISVRVSSFLSPLCTSLYVVFYRVCLNVVEHGVCRGQVKLWKPKVTPMSELVPQGGVNVLPAGTAESDGYVQKTSLAADKPV